MTLCLVAKCLVSQTNAGTVRSQTNFVEFLDIGSWLKRPRQSEFMEREATSGYHRLNRLFVSWVQIPTGKCRGIGKSSPTALLRALF
jgi:hypothetical protein